MLPTKEVENNYGYTGSYKEIIALLNMENINQH